MGWEGPLGLVPLEKSDAAKSLYSAPPKPEQLLEDWAQKRAVGT